MPHSGDSPLEKLRIWLAQLREPTLTEAFRAFVYRRPLLLDLISRSAWAPEIVRVAASQVAVSLANGDLDDWVVTDELIVAFERKFPWPIAPPPKAPEPPKPRDAPSPDESPPPKPTEPPDSLTESPQPVADSDGSPGGQLVTLVPKKAADG